MPRRSASSEQWRQGTLIDNCNVCNSVRLSRSVRSETHHPPLVYRAEIFSVREAIASTPSKGVVQAEIAGL